MILIRYVLRSLNVINGLLLAAIAAVVYFAVMPVLNPAAQIMLPPAQDASEQSGKKAEPFRTLATGDYAGISDQNLFHPERKIPPEKPSEKTLPRPEVFLYGTLITSEGSFAFIGDRKAPPPAEGRDKRQRTLRKGATLGGYLLSEVEADRIVLVKGDDQVVVMLSDREKRRDAERRASQTISRTTPGASLDQPASVPGQPSGSTASPPSSSPASPSRPGTASPSSQTASPHGPGIGSSGVWPLTQSSVEQTRQKLQEALRIRAEQLQGK
jgi:hypothetical protein